MEDELLDLVNEFDQVIGQEYRSNVYKNQLKYTRVVNAFIVNSKGQLWIPRRTAHKELFPSALDVRVGGHVSASENYETAFWREAQEELGLDIRNISYTFHSYFSPIQHNVSCFMQTYEIFADEIPPFNKNDFSEYYWLYPQEILDRIEKGDTSKGDLPKLIKLMYLNSK